MKYTRDLDYSFCEEAKKRGIDVDQLPSGEQHIYCREMEKQLDQHLNILTKVYFDQMEKRGFTKKSQQKRTKQTELDKIVENANKNQAIFNKMLGGLLK